MGLEAVLPGPQNALYVMLCYVREMTQLPREHIMAALLTKENKKEKNNKHA